MMVDRENNELYLLIVTGLSGAGQTTVLNFLEDNDYFCVDNLPIPLIRDLMKNSIKWQEIRKVALGLDSQSLSLENLDEVIVEIKKTGIKVDILFLDAEDDVLIRRYSQTRRKHPLAQGASVQKGIDRERERLAALRGEATIYIDTSELKPAQLYDRLESNGIIQRSDFVLEISSFGFKRGLPPDADIVYDVRFVPNPYWQESMRLLSGKSPEVIDFVMSFEQTQRFLELFCENLMQLLPFYQQEGKNRLNVAIGCTGGQHRSVCIADEIAKRCKREGIDIVVRHRDLPLMNT